MMKKVGYPPTKAAAVEVAASTDGQLAPPIMGAAAFIIAEYVNVPYVEVIKAAAVPAFASYAALVLHFAYRGVQTGATGACPGQRTAGLFQNPGQRHPLFGAYGRCCSMN